MKTLIVIRHAHRDKPPGDSDNGLSRKGRKQAGEAAEFFVARFGKKAKAQFASSPKLRCRETLAPVAKLSKAKIEINPLLDEGSQLEARARKFLDEWIAQGPPLLVISSHGDWIPVFLRMATGVRAELSKGGWAEIELGLGAAELTWLVQEYSIFRV